MYHLLYHTKYLHSTHRVCLCVSYGSHNKQRFFSLNSINRLVSVAEAQCVSYEVRTEFVYNI
jgi:hypothetical protein